jgi:predicted RNA binding protein YcfA (HicA-like mRNA interferase family)
MIKNVLEKVLSGLNDKNIKFNDLRRLILDLGFSERIKGSHHIYFKTGIIEIINLQSLKDGKAKAYQVKQVRNIILKYELHKEEKNV